eukprot:CAMPEP_0172885396 /NCGR_PEP_ID=MMETSP1075-20121228/127916_1 /TAXON_ID=2916 /ORGANISM="Ceratium fusus, Strain PA161109" /LENGTH=76 /DNA_ID=CAMNT_0013738677 /DNA_START=54 /DNA_END=280 /DNA_ORIENTATION=-
MSARLIPSASNLATSVESAPLGNSQRSGIRFGPARSGCCAASGVPFLGSTTTGPFPWSTTLTPWNAKKLRAWLSPA